MDATEDMNTINVCGKHYVQFAKRESCDICHAPAPSDLERQVREKWEAVKDGNCECTEFVMCDACRANHSFCTFVQMHSYRIAEALVARLPKEEK